MSDSTSILKLIKTQTGGRHDLRRDQEEHLTLVSFRTDNRTQ